MEAANLTYFVAISIMLTIAPGPDIFFVMAQSISQGKRSGIAIALGLCTGLIVHTTAASLGISAVLYQSTVVFQFVKYAGAIYLIYLAWQALKEESSTFSMGKVKKQQFFHLYKRGIFMNILNPKVSLFFLAFLPQFASTASGSISMQMILLGLLFTLQAVAMFTLVAVLSGIFSQRFFASQKIGKGINRFKAIVFTIIGIRLAFIEK